ncbi:MAG: hypothetical protein AAF485_05280 [Chloroflexota bacterium]
MNYSKGQKTSIIVRKKKFDGRIKSEWTGDLLPLDSKKWRVILHHPKRHQKISLGVAQPYQGIFVHCCSLVQPLTVLMQYDLKGHFVGAKCDAALPAKAKGKFIDFVDLDLDVIVEADMHYFIRDEETFARNRKAMGYPNSVVKKAHRGIELGEKMVTTRRFPFDEQLLPRLDKQLLAPRKVEK